MDKETLLNAELLRRVAAERENPPKKTGTPPKCWVVRYRAGGSQFCVLEDFRTKEEADARAAKMMKEGTELAWSVPQ